MSLLSDAFEPFVIVNKVIVDDGYGGTVTEWHDGATIEGALVYDSSAESRIAGVLGSTSSYTLTVRKELVLDFHTVIRRKSDNKIFRLTSNSDDKYTPRSAALNMRQYTAEEWKLT